MLLLFFMKKKHFFYKKKKDILLFLPGQEEILDAASLLKKHLKEETQLLSSIIKGVDGSIVENVCDTNDTSGGNSFQNIKGIGRDADAESMNDIINGVLVCVLYAALPPDAQMIAFQPRPKGCNRKVILATNIAETSITVEGIKFVVDTGKYKIREFSSVTGMESLKLADVSKGQVGTSSHVKHFFGLLFFKKV
jgi:HrpA-like RNA helicase